MSALTHFYSARWPASDSCANAYLLGSLVIGLCGADGLDTLVTSSDAFVTCDECKAIRAGSIIEHLDRLIESVQSRWMGAPRRIELSSNDARRFTAAAEQLTGYPHRGPTDDASALGATTYRGVPIFFGPWTRAFLPQRFAS